MADNEKVPWEQDGQEFDADKAKKYLTALLEDKTKLQERLSKLTTSSKDKGSKAAELEKENLRLKVQLNTGLSDRQVARLVGDDFDALMQDAEAYASETGLELRSFINDPEAGTAGEGQSQENDEGEQQRQFVSDYSPPRRQMVPEDTYDAKAIIDSMDF